MNAPAHLPGPGAAWTGLDSDSDHDHRSIRVQPGELYVTGAADERIVTVLGSCVSACVRNPFTGFGGLNHFMLPESGSGEWNGVEANMRYGNFAMEALIDAVIATGCGPEHLEIKLFGGANFGDGGNNVGQMNARFALAYLRDAGLRIASADLGGSHGRRIHFYPVSGIVRRKLLGMDIFETIGLQAQAGQRGEDL